MNAWMVMTFDHGIVCFAWMDFLAWLFGLAQQYLAVHIQYATQMEWDSGVE